MTIFIRANRWQLYLKIIGQFLLIGADILFGYGLSRTGVQSASGLLMLLFFIVLVLSTIFNLLQLIYLPINVFIGDSALMLKFLLRPLKMVSMEDIESYNATAISTTSTLYHGVIINLKSGKKVLVSDFSLQDYTEVKLFLEKWEISFGEKINFKPIDYYCKAV